MRLLASRWMLDENSSKNAAHVPVAPKMAAPADMLLDPVDSFPEDVVHGVDEEVDSLDGGCSEEIFATECAACPALGASPWPHLPWPAQHVRQQGRRRRV